MAGSGGDGDGQCPLRRFVDIPRYLSGSWEIWCNQRVARGCHGEGILLLFMFSLSHSVACLLSICRTCMDFGEGYFGSFFTREELLHTFCYIHSMMLVVSKKMRRL